MATWYSRNPVVSANTWSSHDPTVGGTPIPPGYVKVWTGTYWRSKPLKYYTGTEWLQKPVKVWTGAAWIAY